MNGFIYSYFGRKRRLPNVTSKDRGLVGHTVRSGLNFLVQSAASDINLFGGIDMQAYILANGMKSRIFALVHDSLLAEVPDDEVDRLIEAGHRLLEASPEFQELIATLRRDTQ